MINEALDIPNLSRILRNYSKLAKVHSMAFLFSCLLPSRDLFLNQHNSISIDCWLSLIHQVTVGDRSSQLHSLSLWIGLGYALWSDQIKQILFSFEFYFSKVSWDKFSKTYQTIRWHFLSRTTFSCILKSVIIYFFDLVLKLLHLKL